MNNLLKASPRGLEIVDRARKRMGWTKTNTACWWQDAHTSRATLRRFWHGDRIGRDIFIGICQTVGISDWQAIAEPIEMPEFDDLEQLSSPLDWDDDAPDIGEFYGRQAELEELVQWIDERGCRLVAIVGMAGMGKTALAVNLVEHLQTQFEKIIWRSLYSYPTLPQLLENLLHCFRLQSVQNIKQDSSHLLHQLQQSRCLLVLDGWETILLQDKEPDDNFLNYNNFLRQLSRDRHPGCVLLTSQEKPQIFDAELGAGVNSTTRCLSLNGLDITDAIALLQRKGVRGQTTELAALSRVYGGNPLALQVSASLIQSLFGGNLNTFISQPLSIPDRVRALLQQQLDRLSAIEKELAYWLAIWQEPISFCRLQTHLLGTVTADLVLDGIIGLERHALLEKYFNSTEPSFTLHPLLVQAVTHELIETVTQEIDRAIQNQDIHAFQIARSHLLLRPGTDNIEGDRLLTQLRDRLWRMYGSALPNVLQSLLNLLGDRSPMAVGYTRYNLAALLNRLD
jgi:NB-ARC domain